MRKGAKYAVIFTSGVTVGFSMCGCGIASYALREKNIREVVVNKMAKKILNMVYGKSKVVRNNPYPNASYAVNKGNVSVYEIVIFESIDEAERVKESLIETAEKYGVLLVSDLYDLAEVAYTRSYKENKYGWTSLKAIRESEVKRAHNGYVINLPYPIEIE